MQKSPFPGMEPLIEASGDWGDFHDKLIGEIERALSRLIPSRYILRLASRSYLVIDEGDKATDHAMLPDVAIKRPIERVGQEKQLGAKAAGSTAIIEPPIVMQAPLQIEHRETFIEIFDLRADRQLVTGIEVLSPSNKMPGTRGWRVYQRRRRSFLEGAANLVEIDLLREGRRMPMRQTWPDSPNYVLVARPSRLPLCEVWPVHALNPVPRIPIPLAEDDEDIPIDLQPLIDTIYDRSRYSADIDYGRFPPPVLTPPEVELLNQPSRRKSS